MEDFSSEQNFRWHHGVFFWEVKLSFEEATLIGSTLRPGNLDLEMSEVGLTWLGVDSHNLNQNNNKY